MKTKKGNSPTIPSFADFLKIWQTSSDQEIQDFSQYIKSSALLDNVFSLGPCFVYMMNYKTMSYLYMSSSVKNLLGYDSKEIMTEGPNFLLTRMHPDDIKDLMENTFKKLIEYYNNTPLDQKKTIRSSYDYRIKRADGKYARLLQQNVIVDIDKDGNPLVDIGIISDITEYKKDTKISLLISRYDPNEGFVTLNTPADLEPKKDRISQRELEILKLLMQGFSSKKIADELHISINTVKNHRQNLLEKTKSKNIAELITFALSNSII